MHLFDELKRRKVHRAAALYVAAAWAGTEIVLFLLESFPVFPHWADTVVAILFVLGFPVTMFLAWTFDVGRDGVHRTAPGSTAGRLTLVASLVLLLAATAGLSWWLIPTLDPRPETAAAESADAGGSAPPNSVAVLPFANLGSDEETAWFTDGVTEEILNRLARLDALQVAARTSAFRFRDPDRDVRDIARQLDVRYIVEGSVRRAGDQLRVTAQLVEADSGYPLWSDRFDGTRSDVFAFQDSVATGVAQALGRVLAKPELAASSAAAPVTTDPDTYDRYLLARQVWRQRDEGPIRRSIELLEQVVAADPEFAPGWTALAAANLTLLSYSREPGDAAERAEAAARTGLTLDTELAEGHAVLANIAVFRRDWVEADTRFRRAVELNANEPTVRLWYSELLIKLGHVNRGIEQVSAGLRVDPLYLPALGNAGHQFASAGQIEEAAALFQRTWDLGLKAMFVWIGGFYTALMQERWTAAESWLEQRPFPGGIEADRALLDALRSGSEAERDRLIAVVRAGIESGFPLREGVLYLGAVDATDVAYPLLQPAVAGGWVSTESLWAVWTDDIRRDPRFHELLAGLGMLPYFELYGPPDRCALNDGRITCDG